MSKSKMIKTSKTGVYYHSLKNGDKVFYFLYKDINDLNKNSKPKNKWIKVGKYSEGIREQYAFNLRNEQINKMKFGEDNPLVSKKKKKEYLTLNTIAELYFKDMKIKTQQVAKYKNHIEFFLGNKNIENISKKEILEYKSKLIDGTLNYPTHLKNKRNLLTGKKSNETVNGIINLINAIYNHYIKEYNQKIVNPCFKISKLKTDNARERFLNTNEINELIECIKSNKTLWLFVKLSLSTGGRLETILNIQKKDIDLSNKTITLKNLKTDETYKGFIQTDLIEFLTNHLEKLKSNDYIISFDESFTKSTDRQIQSRLKPILDKLFNTELDVRDAKNRVVIHTLRHTFASHLAINGISIYKVKELMNHKDIEQTMRYAKLAPDSGRNEVVGLYK